MFGGQVVRSGGPALASKLESGGFDEIRAEAAAGAVE